MSNYYQDPVPAPLYSGRTMVSHYQKFPQLSSERGVSLWYSRAVHRIMLWTKTVKKLHWGCWRFLSSGFSTPHSFYDLYKSQRYKWAAVTLGLMFRTFLFHTGVFFYDFIKAKCNAESFDTRARLKKLPMHFPFFLPLINCYNTWRLYRLGFGMKGFDDRNWKDVEEIQDQAGTAGMFESLTESGPQSVVQLTIILSTGRISTAQEFGLPL